MTKSTLNLIVLFVGGANFLVGVSRTDDAIVILSLLLAGFLFRGVISDAVVGKENADELDNRPT